MSLQTRNAVPVEEVQKIQKSLWRQSAAAKEAIRDAASRVLEHVRSRETFLLEQVELLERAKFETLIENADVNSETDVNEVILEFASMALGVEAGLRTLCDAIANFGPEIGKKAENSTRTRYESGGSSLESDFCVLENDSVAGDETPGALEDTGYLQQQRVDVDPELVSPPSPSCHFAFLENSPISEWLLNADALAQENIVGFFGEASRYALDHAYWLKQEEQDEEEEMEEEEEEKGWEKWLHPSSTNSSDAKQAFFSEYMQFLVESSHEEWMKENQDEAVQEQRKPLKATAAVRRSSVMEESWLMSTPHNWNEHHHHHYGECVDSCRALPVDSAEMEIENLGALSCLHDPENVKEDQEDALSQWIMKPRKGKIVTAKSRKNQQQPTALSEWLSRADSETSSSSSTSTSSSAKNYFDVTEWLKTSEQELVEGLCKANEPCSGFGGCLADINCKKSGKTDDEEKEKEDEKKEKESSDADSEDEWVLPKKSVVSPSSSSSLGEEKVNQFMRNYQVISQDFWLTS